jgi:GT2 family glycosyltransferase
MDNIYILLPVHNRRDQTEEFINCLTDQTYKNYHLILIDDGSTDGTAEVVQAKIPSATVIRGQGDWWWAGGLQQGINWLKQNQINSDDIILMINDDVIFEPDFLELGVKILGARLNTLLCAQRFGQQTKKCRDAGIRFELKTLTFSHESSPEKINCLSTMGLFLKFSDLLRIGDFYPRFLPHYLSDYEYTIRAHRKGFSLYTTPELKLWNNETTTGPRKIKQLGLIEFIKIYFSNRFPENPLTWSAFVILTYPKILIPYRLLLIWRTTLISILRQILDICRRYLMKLFRLNETT